MNDKTKINQVNATGHWKELFPKKNLLLGSHNLNDNEILVATIERVEISEFRNQVGEVENAPTLYFTGVPPMILNVTNSRAIERLYGWKYKDWRGKSIQIFRAPNKSKIGGSHKLVVAKEKPVLEMPKFDKAKHLSNAINAYKRDGGFDKIAERVVLTDDDKLTIEAASKEVA